MNSKNFMFQAISLLALLYSPGSYAFYISWDLNPLLLNTTSAHEELTRQAVLDAAQELKKLKLEIVIPKTSSSKQRNIFAEASFEIIKDGNVATDIPKRKSLISILDYWNLPKDMDWHNNSNTQNFHFLRNSAGDQKLESAHSACINSRFLISKISLDAAKYWQEKKYDQALFLMGHALHIIQDSFSAAHTRRSVRSKNNDLTEVCYFAKKRIEGNSLCFHEHLDYRDHIWLEKGSEQIAQTKAEWADRGEKIEFVDNLKEFNLFDLQTEQEKRSRLSHLARLARTASAKYLVTMAKFLKEKPNITISKLLVHSFYKGSAKNSWHKIMTKGVLRCEQLSKK